MFVEDRLFATLDPLTREVDLAENTRCCSRIRSDSFASCRTISSHRSARRSRKLAKRTCCCTSSMSVIPCGKSSARWSIRSLPSSARGETPVLYVFNKVDRLGEDALIPLETRIQNLVPGAVFVSATTDEGLEPLRRALLAYARNRRPVTEIRLPLSDGKMLAEIHREAEVLDQRHEGDELVLTARLDEALAGRLRQGGAAIKGTA